MFKGCNKCLPCNAISHPLLTNQPYIATSLEISAPKFTDKIGSGYDMRNVDRNSTMQAEIDKLQLEKMKYMYRKKCFLHELESVSLSEVSKYDLAKKVLYDFCNYGGVSGGDIKAGGLLDDWIF